MQTDWIHSFLVLKNYASMTVAAQHLNISQQGLSRHIRMLEEHLGVPLFTRNPKGIEISEEGKHLLPYFEKMKEMETALLKEAEDLKDKAETELSIWICPGVHFLLGPAYLPEHTTAGPGVKLKFHYDEDAECLRALQNRIAAGAFVVNKPDEQRYESILLADSPLVALVNVEDPLADKEEISLYDLKGKRVAIPDESHQKTRDFKAVYPDLYKTLVLDLASNEYEHYFLMPCYTDCVALTFDFLCPKTENQLKKVRIREKSSVCIYFCWQKNGPHHDILERFGQEVRHQAQQYMQM